MDSSNYKLYHKHGFDSRQHLEHYLSDKPDMAYAEDLLIFPIENLKKTFAEGHIKGDILIDLSIGSMVHPLYSACEFFKNVIVIKTRDRCIMELKRWVDKHTGAFDWGHAAKLHVDMEENSDQLLDKEVKMKSALQHVVKCNLEKENITDPIVLPAADCIISAWLLDAVCKDQDDYIRYLRKFSRLLKPGGHLILIASYGTTYVTVGKEKFHALSYDEEFVRKALSGEGFVIDNIEVKERTAVCDLLDYKATAFIVARKEK
ncbi:nicotinamide N-methyltransferase-like [Bufo bufo]|uniref:nicotinamide N-methyltransferase-like n=1 Tax=Bufo bufo TaxID=8384 RepID=UPI001ABED2EC|nr:nicotinamide N-methyltransferase-like [Bufo bufo]